jgi:hypothetical protein
VIIAGFQIIVIALLRRRRIGPTTARSIKSSNTDEVFLLDDDHDKTAGIFTISRSPLPKSR